jgi:cobalt-zinc-cadmium efflux system outer membrane protein
MFQSRSIGTMLMITCLVAFPKTVVGQAALIIPSTPKETTTAPPGYGLEELVSLGMTKHPRLSQASLAIESARGRALQAGLYPNPTVSFNFDELGDRTGPQGVNTLPLVTQEIVTGGKLRLSQAVAGKEVDQATLLLAQERFELLARIRSAYFDVITTQMRIDILKKLVAIANASVEQGNKQLRGAEAARLDVIQFEVERERLLAELATTEKELPALYRRLAAIIGDPSLPLPKVTGSIDIALPSYELEPLIRFVVDNHPEKQSAIIGISRAQLQLEREKVEPYPNVTLGAGYVRQNQNRSNDWTVNFSLPLPLWNRNQGKISSALAAVGSSQFEVERVENELVDRVSSAFRDFTAARQRTERYKTGIIPRSEEIYRIVDQGYRNGAFDYLKVLDAQRTLSQAHLERIRATGEAWKAASVISGLSMEEEWPRLLPGYVVPKPGDLLPPAAK